MKEGSFMKDDLKSFIDDLQKAETNIKKVHANQKEIYKISRMLPEEEGHRLVVLAQSIVTNVCDGMQKVRK